jgi:hypothetical protein
MQLSKVEFLNNLRLRLLLPPSNTTRLGTILQCACGAKDLVAGMDDHHALDCPLSSGTRSIRHTSVVDAVFDFLRRCFPAAETRKEFSIPGASGRGSVVDIKPEDLLARKKTLRRRINTLLTKANCIPSSEATDRTHVLAEQSPREPPTQPPLVTTFLATRLTGHMAHIPR